MICVYEVLNEFRSPFEKFIMFECCLIWSLVPSTSHSKHAFRIYEDIFLGLLCSSEVNRVCGEPCSCSSCSRCWVYISEELLRLNSTFEAVDSHFWRIYNLIEFCFKKLRIVPFFHFKYFFIWGNDDSSGFLVWISLVGYSDL